jgi:hypothetical protein
VLNITVVQAECLAVCGDIDTQHWHARLGHVNVDALRMMSKEELVWGCQSSGSWRAVEGGASIGIGPWGPLQADFADDAKWECLLPVAHQ